jgi:hypothetical protein
VLVDEVVVQEFEVTEQDKDVAEKEEEEVSILPPPIGYVPGAASSTSSEEEQSMRFGDQLPNLFLLDLLSQSIVMGEEQNNGSTTIEEWQNLLHDCMLQNRDPGGLPPGQAE